MLRKTLFAAAVFAAAGMAGAAQAQQPIKIADVIELSGGGATVGVNWKNAVDLAAKEINDAGGILGRKLQVTHYDTQSDPGVSRAVMTKALDEEPYVVLGPIYSASTKVNMVLTQRAEVPQITGSEATDITLTGNPYIFRTSFGQAESMPKLANYLRDQVKATSVAVVWVNNDFGKGGRDAMMKELKARNMTVTADISTNVQQVDFSAEVIKAKGSGADALFVYLHEEESARFLTEARKQGYDKPIIGETTLMNQKVIDLAGAAVNGVRGHVGLTADAPVPAIQEFSQKFEKAYGYKPDHNAIKGYIGLYLVKAGTEKAGKVDRKALADALHNATFSPAQHPGVLMEITIDGKGDVDRESFLVEVVDGKQKVAGTLPKLGAK